MSRIFSSPLRESFRKHLFTKTAGGRVSKLSLVVFGASLIATQEFSTEPGWAPEPRRLALPKSTSQLIGRQVEDTEDKPVGKIQDLLLDIPSGQVLVKAGRADAEITQAALEEIMQPTNEFVNLDILVTTAQGRVTLMGTVRDEKQKRKVITAVERVAGTGNVQAQLEISGKIKDARL